MGPGWGSEGDRGASRLLGRACSGQNAGALSPRPQRLPPGVGCSLLNHPSGVLGGGTSPTPPPSSSPHQGVLPGSKEHSHFLFTDITPRPRIRALEGFGAGDAPPSLSPQSWWGAPCSSCLPQGLAAELVWLCPRGLAPAQKQGGTIVHVGTDEHGKGRAPRRWPADPAARHSRE